MRSTTSIFSCKSNRNKLYKPQVCIAHSPKYVGVGDQRAAYPTVQKQLVHLLRTFYCPQFDHNFPITFLCRVKISDELITTNISKNNEETSNLLKLAPVGLKIPSSILSATFTTKLFFWITRVFFRFKQCICQDGGLPRLSLRFLPSKWLNTTTPQSKW